MLFPLLNGLWQIVSSLSRQTLHYRQRLMHKTKAVPVDPYSMNTAKLDMVCSKTSRDKVSVSFKFGSVSRFAGVLIIVRVHNIKTAVFIFADIEADY